MSQLDRFGSYQDEASRRREVKKLAAKRVLTATVAALARAEEAFGRLWNRGGAPRDDPERRWRDAWEEFRKDVLDRGNEQARRAEKDLDSFFNRG
jgi:hypothetical protein